MSASNRAALFAKLHKVLRKHYQPVVAPSDRSALEHLLYACVLENGKQDAVDEVFARLQKNYFDWNEVRVTSVPELAEMMVTIPEPEESAKRMKRALQCVFERYYQFDLEPLRKAGLGKAVETLQKFSGVTPFVIDYMVQNALGGHAIPINSGAMALLVILNAVSPADATKNRVPGLERAIPKNKGAEFASLLHQFAVDFSQHPQAARLKAIVLEVDPTAKDRFPKKSAAAAPPEPARAPARRQKSAPPSPVASPKPEAAEKLPPTAPKEECAPTSAESARSGKARKSSPPAKAEKPTPKSKNSATRLARKKPK
jgi:endonuclease-3